MSRPTFGEGVLVALMVGIGGAALAFGGSLVLPFGWSLMGAVATVSLTYLIYLLSRSEVRSGRTMLVLAWIVATLLSAAFAPGVGVELLVQVGLLWMARSYCFHRGPLAALIDLGLAGLGLVAAVWALQRTGSLFLALWTFFLVQAFFVFLAPGGTRRTFPSFHEDPFETAERTAERSIQRLALRD